MNLSTSKNTLKSISSSFLSKLLKSCRFYSLPILSAVLMGTSYIPFYPWALFFCYVPLWLFALKQERLKPILIGAWICQFIGILIGFNWIAFTIREFGFFPWPIAILGLLVFASFANFHIPIALFFWFISKRYLLKKIKSVFVSYLLIFLLLPLYSVICMEYYPMIFDWHFGYTWFYAKWPAFQTAEIWGFQFLNTLTLFFNLVFLILFLSFLSHFSKRTLFFKKYFSFQNLPYLSCKNALWIFIAWALFFIGLNFYGQRLKENWPEADQTVSVLVVQPNIENLSKTHKRLNTDPRYFALSQLINETQKYFSQNKQKPNFILWPEGAYPYSIKYNNKTAQRNFVQKQAQQWQTPIVLSATGQSYGGASNSIFVFNEKGDLAQAPYNKTLLLAFGEYLPGEKWLPVDKLFSYYGRSFLRGTGKNKVTQLSLSDLNNSESNKNLLLAEDNQQLELKNQLSTSKINLGFQICYESLFDFFTRDLAKREAQIIVNVANDSWYGSWQQPWQNLYMTLARAIEVRRPLVRGTNTGLSAFISAKGEITNISALNKQMHWMQEVPYYSKKKNTIFTSYGYYIDQYFLWGLFVIIFFYVLIFNRILDNKKVNDNSLGKN